MITPLPRQAVAIVRDMELLSGPEGFVFRSLKGKGRHRFRWKMMRPANT